jgi:asparagine synthase (glutamine-hydrolysing)
MACGLEVRVPMLDRSYVETMAELPERLKIQNGRGKFALRRAMEPALGRDAVQRPKRGFEVPLDNWFTGPLSQLFQDTLLSGRPMIREWINPVGVREVFSRLRRGKRGYGVRLWTLLMLELWSRRVLPQRAPAAPVSHEKMEPALAGVVS